MAKRPSFQFYPGDWRKDPELRSCSIAARGLWIDMMCIMHEAEPYGHLCVNGKPMDDAQLARSIGEPPRSLSRLRAELEDAGVFDRLGDGTIVCRRMVQDEHIRTVRSAAGAKGAAARFADDLSEQLPKQNGQQNHGKRHAREGAPAGPPAHSSSSSSSLSQSSQSESIEGAPANGVPPVVLPSIGIEEPPADAVTEERRQRLKQQLVEIGTTTTTD